MDDGIAKAHERLDTVVTIDGEHPGQQNLMMYSGKGYTIEDSGINYRDVVTKTDLNTYATQEDITNLSQDISELSSQGIIFQNGGFEIGTNGVDNELIYAPENSIILANQVADASLISLTQEGYLRLQYLDHPTAPRDAVTKEYVENNVLTKNTIIDYGATGFTLTDVDNFTIDHQHCYQIGNLLFIHIIFRTKKKIETTGIFNVGTLSIQPAHVHSCALVTANPNVQDDVMKVEPAYINKDGNLSFNLTKAYSTSNYTLDITTFYCTDMTVDTPTE
jgi:hypothetical protein